MSKRRAGLDNGSVIASATSIASTPVTLSTASSSTVSSSVVGKELEVVNEEEQTPTPTAAATATGAARRPASFTEEAAAVEVVPDLASVSSVGSTSRASSKSASTSPVRQCAARRESENAKVATVAVKNDPLPPTNSKSPSVASTNVYEEAPEETVAISRRLVEYFVMVSCVPIVDSSAIAKAKLKTKTRPPDPTRDKMNSRTKGRFDVRRVHLLASTITADSVSSNNESNLQEDSTGSMLLEPQITARHPPIDHADQPLNLRLPQFCHPEGTELIHPTLEYKMPRVHYFVLTDSMGGKLYGTALTVYEEFKGENENESGRKESGNSTGEEKKTYYAPRVLTLLSTYPYLTAFRTYLTQLYRLATTTNCMTSPIERYIQNICSEVPAPPPGAFEVELIIHHSLPAKIRFWAPPADQPIPYVSLPFQELFECLDIGNILYAWYTLACEQKVLLVSSQLSLLTVCAEILASLLFPMKWSHLYIPILPRSLSPMLDAPMPYLCGISRENFMYACEDISDETVVVDLDRNVITLGPNTPDLPPLPHARRKKLEGTLKANVGHVFWEARNLSKNHVLKAKSSGNEGLLSEMLNTAGAAWEEKVRTRDDAFSLAYAPDSVNLEVDEDANVGFDNGSLPKQSRWDAVQEAFLRFYVSLLQDYRKFLPDEASMDERSTWRGKGGLSSLRFQTEEFVAASPTEFQPFLEELVMTQQFDDFVTRKMHNAGDAPDIKFFDQSIDAKRNRSMLKLKKKETPFLNAACAHRDLKRVKAVEPNGEGLPEREDGIKEESGVYMYKMWPTTFDDKLFGTPRPIPSIISAEFDRRTALRSMLSSKYGIVDGGGMRSGLGGRNKSPEVTSFILFFATFTSVIGKELSSVEQKHGTGSGRNLDDKVAAGFGGPLVVQQGTGLASSGNSTRQSLTNLDDDTEVARTITKAQIDLAYHTLSLMRARKLPPEPIAYKLLIQACGRCNVTHRTAGLMEMLARDGLATNPTIYTSLITAFSNDNEGQPSSLALYQMQHGDDNMSNLSSSDRGGSTRLLDRRRSRSSSRAPSEQSLDLISESSPSETSSLSGTTKKSRMKISPRLLMRKGKVPSFRNVKATKSKRKLISSPSISKKYNLKLTAAIAKQIELGENLLESLYPSIDIDNENVCPKCATVLNEDDICTGWTPCASNEYQTQCPSCSHKFVPKFSITCQSPTFEGSQGKGTPLYCDHLSPWVLLREMRSVITATGGIDGILDEKSRSGPDITGMLFWNMIVTFKRYKLPYIFLLQGSFHNNLILPSPSLSESMTDIS